MAQVRLDKLMESIPFYTGCNDEEFDVTLHILKEFSFSKIKLLQDPIKSNTHRYQMVVLFYDGSTIQSYTWEYIEGKFIAAAIANAVYISTPHGALAIILKENQRSKPNISIATW